MTKFRNQQPVQHTGPLCNGKITHVTGARAWAEAKRVSRRTRGRSRQGGPPVKPYRCPDCGLYHLGR